MRNTSRGVVRSVNRGNDRPAIEPRNEREFGMPTALRCPEGYTVRGAKRQSRTDPTRSETLSMSGSDLHGSWEVSVVPAQLAGVTGKVKDRNPVVHAAEKSDTPIVPEKPPNKGEPAEAVEGRGVAKGNAFESPAGRTQSRVPASKGLEGIREAARQGGAISRQTPKAGALCGNAARRDLCGGQCSGQLFSDTKISCRGYAAIFNS